MVIYIEMSIYDDGVFFMNGIVLINREFYVKGDNSSGDGMIN